MFAFPSCLEGKGHIPERFVSAPFQTFDGTSFGRVEEEERRKMEKVKD